MADIAWDPDVITMDPPLSAVDPVAQALIIAFVNDELEVSYFGGEDSAKTRLARVFLACHIGRVSITRGSAKAGPVISESMAGISRSYANLFTAAQNGGAWVGTSWADAYNSLVQTSLARLPQVILGRPC